MKTALDFDPRREHGDGQLMADYANEVRDPHAETVERLVDFFSEHKPIGAMVQMGYDEFVFAAAHDPYDGDTIYDALNDCIRRYAERCVETRNFPQGFRA